MSISAIRSAITTALGDKASLGRVTMGYERVQRGGEKRDLQRLSVEFISPAGEVSASSVLVEPGMDITEAAVNLAAFYIAATD